MGLNFNTLWNNYPTDSSPCRDRRTNEPVFENQCAIRLGLALQRSGVNFGSFRGDRCPNALRNSGMVINAQALANWLQTRPFSGCPRPEFYTGSDVFENIEGITGIIFFADYWQRPNEQGTNNRSGDHIDLWNGSRLTSRSSAFRIHLHLSWDGRFSDYRRARQVLFWEIPGDKNYRTAL